MCCFEWILGQTLMMDPVLASDGHTYERKNIEKWFSTCAQDGLTGMEKSPMSGGTFPNRTLVPNLALRKAIEDLLKANPGLCEQLDRESKEEDLLAATQLLSVQAPADVNAKTLRTAVRSSV